MLNDSFFITGGTLPSDANSYIARRADTDLLDGLRSGEFCYVLNTRQMGKSSLMVRAANQLKAEGCRVAILDLTAVGKNLSVEQWYFGLLSRVATQVGSHDDLPFFWKNNRELGPMQRFVEGLRRLLIEGSRSQESGVREETSPTLNTQYPTPSPLVLFVDEIDAVLSLPFSADEFFAGIRECYNRRAQEPVFARLTFCLLGVATPADLIRDTRTTPFNIGKRIELRDFTPEEAAPLAQGLGNRTEEKEKRRKGEEEAYNPQSTIENRKLLKRILYWTSGHPYMTQRMCRQIAEQQAQGKVTPADVDRLCERLFLSKAAQESDDNLAFVRNRLLKSEADLPTLLDLYAQVWAGRKVRDDETNPLCGILRLSGAVTVDRGLLRIRNRIYDHVFNKQWVRAHMPDAELQRQKSAYRLGLMRAATGATLIVSLMVVLAAYAFSERNHARINQRNAEAATRREKKIALDNDELATKLRQSLNDAILKQQETEKEKNRANTNEAHAKQSAKEEARSAKAAQDALVKATQAEGHAKQEQLHAQSEEKRANGKAFEAQTAAAKARAATALERKERDSSDTLLYAADMHQAGESFATHDFERAALLLEAHQPHSARDADRRSYDWAYLWGELHATFSLTGHTGDVQGTFNGSSLVTLDSNLDVRAWDGATGALTQEHSLRHTAFTDALLAPGGRVVALYKPNSVTLRDTKTFTDLFTIPLPGKRVAWLFSINGRYLAVSCADANGTLLVMDVLTGKTQHRLTGCATILTGAPMLHIPVVAALSGDGRLLAAGIGGAFLGLYQLERETRAEASMKPLLASSLNGLDTSITGITFSPDSKFMASAEWNGRVVLWNVAQQREQAHLKPSNTEVSSPMAFSPDSKWLAVGRRGSQLFLWNCSNNSILHTLATDPDSVRFVAFSPDGLRLAAGTNRGCAHIWDISRLEHSRLLPIQGAEYARGAFSPRGDLFAITTKNGKVALWETNTWTLRREIVLPQGGCAGVAFSPDSREIAIGSTDRRIYLWDVSASRISKTLTELASIGVPFSGAWELSYSPDGKYLAAGQGLGGSYVGTGDYILMVWERRNYKPVQTLHHAKAIAAMAFSPDSHLLASGSHDNIARVWQTADWKLLHSTVGGSDNVTALSFTPDSSSLAIGSWNPVVLLMDSRTGRTQKTFVGHRNGVYSISFTPDGRTMATASDDNTVRVWDVVTGKETRVFSDSKAHFKFVGFSPQGTTLVSDAGDEIRVWQAAAIGAIDRQIRAEMPGREFNRLLARAQQGALTQRWQAVIDDSTSVLRQKPNVLEAYQLRGEAYAKMGRYNLAFSDFAAIVHLRGSAEDVIQAANAAKVAGNMRQGNSLYSEVARLRLAAEEDTAAAVRAYQEQQRSARLVHILPRSREAASEQIDLTTAYNATFDQPWIMPHDTRRLYLIGLQAGLQTLSGTCYDARGVIQLHSPAMPFQYYPDRVDGIALNRACSRLYFLHSASWWAKPGKKIGAYTIHYADGVTESIPLIYAVNIAEWLLPTQSLPGATVAWVGEDTGLNNHGRPHLFQLTWENPRPRVKITSIDFVTAGEQSVPFLIALTAQ